ncbi:unnamed protein product [Musa banksii]
MDFRPDHVPLYANKVGPFHNPSETYRSYDLPFCSPEHVTEKTEALGEVLNDDRLVDAPYELYFLEEQQSKSLCQKKTCPKKMLQSSDMLLYQRTITYDLPLWGLLGKIKGVKTDSGKDKYFIFKHIHFNILYNDDRVIEINVQTYPNI